MTCGRFTAGLVSEKLGSWKIISLSLGALAPALLLLLLSVDQILVTLAFFFLGVGIGPVFPNIAFLTPAIFGPKKSPSIMGTQMAAGSLALMLVPIACGIIGQHAGMWVFPVILLAFFAPLVLSAIRLYTNSARRRG